MGALLSLFRFVGLVRRGAAALRRVDGAPAHARAPPAAPTAAPAANGNAVLSGLGFLFRLLTSAPVKPKPPPPTCPICMEPVPASVCPSSADAVQPPTAITLTCDHVFCHECVAPYVAMKVRERQVEQDQLVCPVVECKRSLTDRDLRLMLPAEAFDQYKRTLQRVRDEKNPMARWCPRATCGELIVCAPDTSVFTCSKCATTGCFHCRGASHRFAFLCKLRVKTASEDASYARWESSVGHAHAVRACPNCHMRIWKSGGCNHMTCTHCRHEYCWVCQADWQSTHYACREQTRLRQATTTLASATLGCVAAVTRIPVPRIKRRVGQALWCLGIGMFLGVLLVAVVAMHMASLVGTALAPLRRWWRQVGGH